MKGFFLAVYRLRSQLFIGCIILIITVLSIFHKPLSLLDNHMQEELLEFTQRGPYGAKMHLDSITDFEWDKVYPFAESMPLEFMQKSIGRPLVFDKHIQAEMMPKSALLIFLKNKQVVHMLVIAPPLFLVDTTGDGYMRARAVITIHTKNPGPYSIIRFQDN